MTLTASNVAADPFAENLAALWAVEPAIARLVEAADDLALVPTRSGHLTAAVRSNDDAPVYLQSRYDPPAEAAKQIAAVDAEILEVFLLGLGLGYSAQAILEKAGAATVWAFEVRPEVIRAALRAIDFSEHLLGRRLRLVATLDKPTLFDAWTGHLASASAGQCRVEQPASVRLDPVFYKKAGELLDEFQSFGRTTINTLLRNGRRTCENLAHNIPWYVAAESIGRLKNLMAGKPAVIVSAGPSLRKNKHLLKEAGERAVIVAVQTTFQQLIDLGVEPDFVTSLDYHDICTQFFRNVPKHVRTELVAEPKATPKIFDLHPGPLSLLGNDFIDRILAEMKLDRPRLPGGATVAHLAFYLAQHLGCDPIIFVGQDLGFSDGLAYAPGTSYDDLWRPELGRFNSVEMMQWQRIVRDRPILRRVPDFHGKPTYTEERLFSYLQQFERDFASSRAKVIDATEGGVAKAGAVPMTLADALAEFCGEKIEKPKPQCNGRDWSKLAEAEACLLRRREEAERVEAISRETLPLLDQMSAAIHNAAECSRLAVEVDELRKRMNELSATYELITQLSQQSELDRFTADKRIEAAGIDASEKQRRQLRRDKANVAHVAQSAADFQALMNECIELVREQAAQQEAA
ncbi:MAG: DUF115 domain-containing protein [Tepidisphaeraceae bacterium]